LRRSIWALAIAFILAVTVSPVPASAQSSNGLVTLVVYPDGSLSASFVGTSTSQAQQGTVPVVEVQGNINSSNGLTTSSENGTVSIPPGLLSEVNYTSSETLSASGSYSAGRSEGVISIEALAGVSSPLSSFSLTYQGTTTNLRANGSATLQYGTYAAGSTQVEVNATSIGAIVAAMQESFFSTSYLNKYVSMLPYANLTVTAASITAQIGTSSATINGNLEMQGNITALPASLETYALCSSGQVSPSACRSYFNLYVTSFSSIQEYNYKFEFSNGIMGFSLSSTSKVPAKLGEFLNEELSNETASLGIKSVLTTQQEEFLNSTAFNFSGFRYKITENQAASGEATTNLEASGLTIVPKLTITNDSFTESGLFNILSEVRGNITLVGGASAAGSVSITVPSGVPPPSFTTAHTATWDNVNFSELAGVEFRIGPSTSSSYLASNAAITNGGASANDTSKTGVSVTVSGLQGLSGSLTLVTQQLSGPSQGESAPGSGTAQYYDVFVAPPPGSSVPNGATATLCVRSSGVTSATVIMYWSGSAWVSASSPTVTGNTACGMIPVSALAGTNVAAFTPSSDYILYLSAGIVVVAAVAILGAILIMRRRRAPTPAPATPTPSTP
jgi:hypothetical protein